MTGKLGFNDYKIFNNFAVIYLHKRTGEIFETKVDIDDLQKLISLGYRWCARYDYKTKTYYACSSSIRGKTLTMNIIVLGTNPSRGEKVDHINGDTLDNRKSNLRVTTQEQNNRHRTDKNSNNKSGYRNVCLIDGWYRVQLQIDGKNHRFPEKFKDAEKAGEFAEQMRQKYYGEYAGNS